MNRPVVVIGSGGFGREAVEVIQAAQSAGAELDLLGFVDDDAAAPGRAILERAGIRYLGGVSDLVLLGEGHSYVVGIGDPGRRAAIVDQLEDARLTAATVVHPRATVGARTDLGPGTVVCAGAQISVDVRLGAHVHVNPNATVGHDVVAHDFVSVNPGAIISGAVVVESRVLVGAGAVVLQGLRIGAGAVIGAAACVTRDVERRATVKGVPAR